MAIVKKITKKQHKGKVFDIKVKDKHSYNIDGLAVHNSGAGSLVLYCLGVTGVDPIKRELSMDRFLYAEAEYRATAEEFFSTVEGEKNMHGEDCVCFSCSKKRENRECIVSPQ